MGARGKGSFFIGAYFKDEQEQGNTISVSATSSPAT
jgi:hypothetical protein